jgi:hypothetical protein
MVFWMLRPSVLKTVIKIFEKLDVFFEIGVDTLQREVVTSFETPLPWHQGTCG